MRRLINTAGWVLGSVLLAGLISASPAGASDGPLTAPAPILLTAAQNQAAAPASIGGFRSAQFDMNQHAVRKAIRKDFGFGDSAIGSGGNPLQQTGLLSISVPSLIPGSGKAAISYVFGFKSKGIVEINIVWTTAADAANTQDALVHTGAILQNYFEQESFPANKSLANAVLADGSIVLFRGIDSAGHAVVLVLSGSLSTAKSQHAVMVPNTLSLVYASDPDHPDIFQLAKGSF